MEGNGTKEFDWKFNISCLAFSGQEGQIRKMTETAVKWMRENPTKVRGFEDAVHAYMMRHATPIMPEEARPKSWHVFKSHVKAASPEATDCAFYIAIAHATDIFKMGWERWCAWVEEGRRKAAEELKYKHTYLGEVAPR